MNGSVEANLHTANMLCDAYEKRLAERDQQLAEASADRRRHFIAAAVSTERVAVLESALRRYGTHRPTCLLLRASPATCSCGFNAALAGLDAPREEGS